MIKGDATDALDNVKLTVTPSDDTAHTAASDGLDDVEGRCFRIGPIQDRRVRAECDVRLKFQI